MFSGKIELISYTGLYILKSVLEVLSAIFGQNRIYRGFYIKRAAFSGSLG